MVLYLLPLAFALAGLALYVVLGGADFGAGFWQLVGADREIRDHAHQAMAPVWEANHVWLIFVLTVVWTAYPSAFGSIASTLSIPLFIAGIGIVLRGGAYALRSGTRTPAELRRVDTLFAISSILTPFALGTAVGGIASERVHVGNPGGSLVTSWLNPTSITIGALAVATSAYMAAVFLSGDAQRLGDERLAERFRTRALASGLVAGAAALAGIVVLHSDAARLFHRLTHGAGLPALIVSVAAGVATLALLWRRRYEPARYSAALAVAAVVAGWAVAQSPVLLRGLTIREAAAGHDVLVAVVVAVLGGAVILFPSLALLFRLTLRGDLDPGHERAKVRPRGDMPGVGGVRIAAAFLVAGIGLLTVANAPWAHAIGVVCFFGFAVAAYGAVAEEPIARSESVDGTK
ncbi:MAG: cytochrome d ubiquinol oxidase subunit II [Gaiellaceae bacterium]